MYLDKRKRSHIKAGLFLSLGVLLLISTVVVLAQSGGDFTLSWWTVDGGGGTSSSGSYAISGTLGQPDAAESVSGAHYVLQGGFWPGNVVKPGLPDGGQRVLLPFIVR